ncbi:MAG: GNAT family N-acetyltransferase [Chloroflexota bacterium]|nr:MAG: N-acetyltransferase [Chloroflexota bacterium]
MFQLSFAPMDAAAAAEVYGWRYEPPYHVYNLDDLDRAFAVAFLTDPANRYCRIDDGAGELVAFCCFGLDAQVPGGDYSADALDIGMGVRPDLTGRGLGHRFAAAVIDFALRTEAPAALRVTVAAFNLRAQRVWMKNGFLPAQSFLAPSGRAFVMFTAPADRTPAPATPRPGG